MTIDQAITILQSDIDDPGSVAIEDVNQAEQLGIEALKRVKELRVSGKPDRYSILPGETKD